VIETALSDKQTGDLKAKVFTNMFIKGIGGFGKNDKGIGSFDY
jgi:hypothetical protein